MIIMEYEEKFRFWKLMQSLEINITLQDEIVRTYLLARFIMTFKENKSGQAIEAAYSKSKELASKIGLDFFKNGNLTTEDGQVIELLCDYLDQHGLVQDHRRYFQIFAPDMVTDWDVLEHLSEGVGDTLLDIYRMLKSHMELSRTEGKMTAQAAYGIYENSFPSCGMRTERFQAIWDSLYGFRMEYKVANPNPEVRKAEKTYSSNMIPKHFLVDHYIGIIKSQEQGGKAFNPFVEFAKRTNSSYEKGTTEMEVAYVNAAGHLKNVTPFSFLTSLYYKRDRNDALFECTFLLRKFMQLVGDMNARVLVINPSPYFAKEWNAAGFTNTVFALADSSVATLYQWMFNVNQYIEMEKLATQIGAVEQYDYVLFIARDLDPQKLYPQFSCCHQDTKILAFFPEGILTSRKHNFVTEVHRFGIQINELLLVDPDAVNSKPKKKILFSCAVKKSVSNRAILVQKSHYDHENKTFHVDKENFYIPLKWLDKKKTILKLCDEFVNKGKTVFDSEKEPGGLEYRFTREMKLDFMLLAGKRKGEVARIYYRALLREDQKRRKRGDRLTEYLERTLKGYLDSERKFPLEMVALDSKISVAAVSDLLNYYKDEFNGVSLKTIWYLCRNDLQGTSYDENLAIVMFCGDDQTLSDLISDSASQQDFEDAMARVLPPKAGKGVKYWKTLDQIYRCACKKGILKRNPIGAILSDKSRESNKEMKEIRKEMVQREFNPVQDRRIMNFLMEAVKAEDGSIWPRAVVSGVWLGAAMRYFTGISAGEVCARTWGDFKQIQDWDAYYLSVNSYVDNAGNCKLYTDKENRLCRLFPMVSVLADLMKTRLQYLEQVCHFHLDSQYGYPVVVDDELGVKDLPKQIQYCSKEKLTSCCKELMEIAEISPNVVGVPTEDGVMETDLNRYEGDFFYTNFQTKSKVICKINLGDLCYMQGKTPPDVFSGNYCDFGHDLSLYKNICKLNRWTAQMLNSESDGSKAVIETVKYERQNTHILHPKTGKHVYSNLFLRVTKKSNTGKIRVNIDSEHGVKGQMTIYVQ